MTLALTIDRPARPKSLMRSAAVAFFATVTFAVTSTSAFAGANELKALNAYLATLPPAGQVNAGNATSAALADAVIFYSTNVATNNPKKYSPAIIAGEALKASQNTDLGDVIGQKVKDTIVFPLNYGAAKAIDKATFATLTIKTAATGKGLTVAETPDFTAKLTLTDTEAKLVAAGVKASKVAVTAVLKGQSSNIATLAGKEAFATNVLTDKTLTTVIKEATAGVASTVAAADAGAFTTFVLTNSDPLIVKNVLKVIPGIATGIPTEAGRILENAFNIPAFASQNAKSPIVKGAATLAKDLSAIADIEQIEVIGQRIANQISTSVPGAPGKPNVPNLKLSTATAIVTTLAKAIAAKPYADTGANSLVNKADELGELAAYFIGALKDSPEFLATKTTGTTTVAVNASKAVLAIYKAVFTGAKLTPGKAGGFPTATQISGYYADLAEYVSGSIALTIKSLAANGLNANIVTALQQALGLDNPAGTALGDKNLKAIAAVLKIPLADIKTALAAGNAASPDSPSYENGTQTGPGEPGGLGGLVDPETNARTL